MSLTVQKPVDSPPGRPDAGAGSKFEVRKVSWLTRLRSDSPLLMMVVPAFVLLLLFTYLPLLGTAIAFMDYVPFIPITQSPWVGLENFQRLFADPAFWQAVYNTLQITLIQLILYFPIPIALALLLNSILTPWVKNLVQSIAYLPHFLSWVIVVALFQQMFGGSGVVNNFIQQQGGMAIDIMSNPDFFKFLVTSQVIWKDAGWGAIIFLAALASIDDSLYESAAIDGAGWGKRLWHVTLPGIRPIIVLLLILRLGESLNVGFEQILLQRNSVGPAAGEVLDTYVYYNGVVNGDWSVGIAAGVFKGVIGLVLILLANKAAHALGEQGVYKK